MRWLSYIVLVLLLLLAIAVPLAKQVQTTTGCVEGLIVDENGTPVAGAIVEARNILRGLVSRTESKADGSYRIEDLIPGKYSLWAEASGHTCEWIPMVIVQEGQHARQDFTLRCETRRVPNQPTAAHAK